MGKDRTLFDFEQKRACPYSATRVFLDLTTYTSEPTCFLHSKRRDRRHLANGVAVPFTNAVSYFQCFASRQAFFVSRGSSKPNPSNLLSGRNLQRDLSQPHTLPTDQSQWDTIFLGIMGSPDAQYGRRLNGMGGGVSSLSRICVVGSPSEAHKAAGVDVEYTFAQVGIRNCTVHYSGIVGTCRA
jgi:hypothetical protein